MIGDMACKRVAPVDQNWGGRLVKNLRICGSGIYTYAKSELEALHLTPAPDDVKRISFINVYRPPEVLINNRHLFERIPIITGHHVLVDRNNAKALAVGMVGDTVEYEIDKDDGELYLYTTGTIIAGDGVSAYKNYGQLSVGYDPIMEWKSGYHKGEKYHAVLKGFNCINHLLICQTARGGPQCTIMDSLDGGIKMSFLDKLLGRKKELTGDALTITTLLNAIKTGAEPKAAVDVIRSIAGDALKDDVFKGYLDALAEAKIGDSGLADGIDVITKHYQSLMGDSKCGGDKCNGKCKDGDSKKDMGTDKPGTKPDNSKKEPDDKEPEDKDKKTEKSTAGDSIDYDRIAELVLSKMNLQKIVGDTIDAKMKVVDVAPVISGDSKQEVHNSDFFMKELYQ